MNMQAIDANLMWPSVTRWLVPAALVCSVLLYESAADEALEMSRAAGEIRAAFARLDTDRDLHLSAEEYRLMVGDPQQRRRDFVLYDFDNNGQLSRDEFACVAGLVEPRLRGTMPDPLNDLVEDAVIALDESYDHWELRPNELVSAHTFVSNFLESISPGRKRFVTGRIIERADVNMDGKISRGEARQFIQQQLGVRLRTGPRLRELTGRLVRYDRFLEMDIDDDGLITRAEFLDGWPEAEVDFATIDRDHSQSLTYQEYSDPRSPFFFDPVEWFREADSDFNAFLSPEELKMSVEPNRMHLADASLRSFDVDRDQQLSLREYRVSMLSHYNYPWDRRPLDRDRDGKLSYDEFVFDTVDLFQLQRWFFFHRLDLDRDQLLSTEEFNFLELAPLSIRAYSVEGGDSKILHENLNNPDCGWPSISPDGKQVLFHQLSSNGSREGSIVIASTEEPFTRVICRGTHPSWSANGQNFVCQRGSRNQEIWILDSGGLAGRKIAPGHAPKWSPDGKHISYLHDNGVSIFDIETGQIRSILIREDHPFQDLGNDIAWSPDSTRLAVVGNFVATSQLLILSTEEQLKGHVQIRYSFDVACRANLNWTQRDGILVSVKENESRRNRLMSLDPDSDNPPIPTERFQQFFGLRSACLTPDGKWYIAVVEE